MIISADIDECLSGTDTCDQQCVNTIGTYQCACADGFALNTDNITCGGMERNMCHNSKYMNACVSFLYEREYICHN